MKYRSCDFALCKSFYINVSKIEKFGLRVLWIESPVFGQTFVLHKRSWKGNFLNKKGSAIFGRKAEPERIGATVNTIKELTNDCNKENLLKYRSFLCKARHVADSIGLKLIEIELERVKNKYLFLESLGRVN